MNKNIQKYLSQCQISDFFIEVKQKFKGTVQLLLADKTYTKCSDKKHSFSLLLTTFIIKIYSYDHNFYYVTKKLKIKRFRYDLNDHIF